MKFLHSLMLLPALFIATAASAAAQPNIAVVWEERIIAESAVGQHIRQRMIEINTEINAEIEAVTSPIEAEIAALTAETATMTPEAVQARPDLVARGQQVNVDVQQAERVRALRERERAATQQTAFRPVYEAYAEVLEELIEERGYDLLIERTDMVYAAPSIDISDDVIELLNERLPTVPVNRVRLPQQSPDGAQAAPQQ